MLTRPSPACRRLLPLALAALSLSAVGCVERRYTIRTDPPGALVFVNSEESGISPVSVNYDYYGTRRVTIQAEGYETINTELPINAPWWNNAFTGFFTENFVPVTLRDEREFMFTMAPAVTPETGDLVGRGQQLRQQALTPAPERPRGFFRFLAL